MIFLAPGFLYAALAAALATIALHFVATREPRAVALPTARFVPESGTHALVRAARFSDPWLLALRILLLVSIGTALARPVRVPERERIARVILADRSGTPASDTEVRDSVRALYRPGDAVVAFDSAAHYTSAVDSLPPALGFVTGSLSAALVRAHAAASRIRAGTDSIELVIVSPLAAAEADRATARIRATWPGRARLVGVASDTTRHGVAPMVTWNTGARPPRAVPRRVVDSVGAVIAGTGVLIAPFARRWEFPRDSLRGASVIARWVDGEPAAIEWPIAGNSSGRCARSVAIPVDSIGDLVLHPDFLRLRGRVLGECGVSASRPDSAAAAALATMVAGSGPLARASAFPPGPSSASTLAPWLLALALVAALLELLVRRRGTGGAS
jgi:hypothetical protein